MREPSGALEREGQLSIETASLLKHNNSLLLIFFVLIILLFCCKDVAQSLCDNHRL